MLATFGLVLMSNERLALELVASHDRVNEAERAETVGRLAGGVAHNFNNLLHSMIAYAELVEETLAPDDPRRADLDAIRESGMRGATLARQLSALGGRRPAEPTVVDVDAAVAALTPMLEGLAAGGPAPGGRAPVVLTGAAGASALVDAAQLDEIVLTLVLNAVESTPSGGMVAVETSRVDLSAADGRLRGSAAPGPYVRVAVTDGGAPIPAGRLAHAFDPFSSTTSGDWSPSLGLSGANGLAATAGGFLGAETTDGTGNVISLYLPALAPARA